MALSFVNNIDLLLAFNDELINSILAETFVVDVSIVSTPTTIFLLNVTLLLIVVLPVILISSALISKIPELLLEILDVLSLKLIVFVPDTKIPGLPDIEPICNISVFAVLSILLVNIIFLLFFVVSINKLSVVPNSPITNSEQLIITNIYFCRSIYINSWRSN